MWENLSVIENKMKLKSIGDNTTVGIMVQLGEQNYTLLKGDKVKAMEMMKDAKG